ncbi:MAG: hypothetical protein ACOC1I_04680 [Spirochaetota bacterium]
MTHATGRELLAIEPSHPEPECPSLNGRPRRFTTLELDGDERAVRCRTGQGIVLLVLDAKRRFEPGRRCRVDGRPMRLLFPIDSLDPSRRVRLAKRLASVAREEAGDPVRIAERLGEQTDAIPPAPREPSPAARRLRDRLELVPPPAAEGATTAHRVALAKEGLEPVLAELVKRGEVIELDRGHLIAVSNYRRLARELRGPALSASPAEIATGWGCSHGRARAILDRMVRDGLLRRRQGRYEPSDGRAEGGDEE